VETTCAVQELDNLKETTPHRDSETPSEIEITEKVNTSGKFFGGVFSKLAGTGS